MKAYKQYLIERLSDKYGKEAIKLGVMIYPENIEKGLISLWKSAYGEIPNDNDIKPFYEMITAGENSMSSQEEPEDNIIPFRTGTEG